MRPLIVLLLTTSTLIASTPRPLPNHPGNIFVKGEEVTLPPPGDRYKLFDYEGKQVSFGRLPIGYYEARGDDGQRITLGVIAPLKASTPPTSPISIDVAMAWFYTSQEQQLAAANLCQLAGVNWVRDRLHWGVMEPERGKYADTNIYDDTARIQTEAGLKVLQVSHISPPWANENAKRFPHDLRDVYRYNKEMAARWKGKVLAFEPWNEADIEVFGGHTGSEMASMQKAAYLGLKAGNPDVIACQNVFAIARQTTLDDFAANEVAAYFDTYNLHHYNNFEKYPEVYAAHRAVSAGKPMWVTECNVTVQWADEKTREPTDEHLKWQANRVAKVYAMSLHEGSVNTFYFILGHYVERQTQYGIIKPDLTPRPAFIALAAVGRLLADARPLGRWKHEDPLIHAYLFRAKPDGQDKCVLVAWRNKETSQQVQLDAPVEKIFDHLGRQRGKNNPAAELKLTGSPLFAIMPPDAADKLPLIPPPTQPPRSNAQPANVVLQALLPEDKVDLLQSAYILPPGEEHELALRLYNFGDIAVTAPLFISANQWQITMPSRPEITVAPGDMKELKLKLERSANVVGPTELRFRWNAAVLSIRTVDEKSPPKSH